LWVLPQNLLGINRHRAKIGVISTQNNFTLICFASKNKGVPSITPLDTSFQGDISPKCVWNLPKFTPMG
jgi:hypothetical protein